MKSSAPGQLRDCSLEALLSNAARYPIGIWTMPEVAFVGLTAEAAAAPPHNLDVVEGVGRPGIHPRARSPWARRTRASTGRFNDASDAEYEELLTGPVLELRWSAPSQSHRGCPHSGQRVRADGFRHDARPGGKTTTSRRVLRRSHVSRALQAAARDAITT